MKYVTDTHTLYWYLTASPNLGADAKSKSWAVA